VKENTQKAPAEKEDFHTSLSAPARRALANNGIQKILTMENMKQNTRIYTMSFASVYPLYIKKAEKKSRTKAEVDEIIFWLTGYNKKDLQEVLDSKIDFETFFAQAPQMNPNASLIKGMICGYRIEDIEDKLMRNIRYLDKLIDELAKGKEMDKILRKAAQDTNIHPCKFKLKTYET